MAIKFTTKDQPKATPAAPAKKTAARPVNDAADAASNDAAPDGSDLFDSGAKAPAKRKPNGFRR
jgi:hypothetical protein